jgi:hypothetical protein
MMGAGLERQLDRCDSGSVPDFCGNSTLHSRILQAYNHLWDLIEANSAQLSSEVWSWVYQEGEFHVTPLGALPPPPGTSPTGEFCRFLYSLVPKRLINLAESDVRQLWSLTFLAVTRNENLK